jgi:hypothetical protein
MVNFDKFKLYCEENKRSLAVMVNPMRSNWMEMVDFLKFADHHGCNLWYNTIRYPEDQALWNLPTEELMKIVDQLGDELDHYDFVSEGVSRNHVNAHQLINVQIKSWAESS